jgi:hypothetical protein
MNNIIEGTIIIIASIVIILGSYLLDKLLIK